jgi:Fe-Mn family superoxide dismutase
MPFSPGQWRRRRQFPFAFLAASSPTAIIPIHRKAGKSFIAVPGRFRRRCARASQTPVSRLSYKDLLDPFQTPKEVAMAIELPPLPYDAKSLEPFISANTLSFHHGKHHAAYVHNYNNLTKDTPYADQELVDVIKAVAGVPDKQGIFNNAAQVWNHTFFWNSLKHAGGGKPQGNLLSKIEADLGSFDKFLEGFKQAATTQFGSGWAWLVLDNGVLKITKTANADTPLVHGQTPLLTVDVWEHAYYLDYQNRRPDFVSAVLENLINWDFVSHNLNKARQAE